MIIHSIIPLETIFNEKDQLGLETRIIQFNEIKLEVRRLQDESYEINRIISTNPNDYLNPYLQPGSKLKVNHHPGE